MDVLEFALMSGNGRKRVAQELIGLAILGDS